MSSITSGGGEPHVQSKESVAPYVLRSVLSRDRLLKDGLSRHANLTCVEFWDDNLYVGTSTAEVRHYVKLAGPNDSVKEEEAGADFTYATALSVPFQERMERDTHILGVQQILILEEAEKICVLCNGSINFYSLPELSPVFTSTTGKLFNCTWIGGIDLNEHQPDNTHDGSKAIMICQRNRIRLVSVGSRVQHIRDIDFSGCLEAIRRGNIACVADGKSYALLNVVEQQRRDLFDISSVESFASQRPTSPVTSPSRETTSDVLDFKSIPSQNSDFRANHANTEEGGRGPEVNIPGVRPTRNSSRSAAATAKTLTSSSDITQAAVSRSSRSNSPSRETHDLAARNQAPDITSPPSTDQVSTSQIDILPRSRLRPLVISPTMHEFLLTTGTKYDEPAAGMFVNMEGEVTRAGTIEFSVYPEALCSDRDSQNWIQPPSSDDTTEEGYVLALVSHGPNKHPARSIEIRRWGVEPPSPSHEIDSIQIPCAEDLDTNTLNHVSAGLREVASSCEVNFNEINQLLQLSRIRAQMLHRDDTWDAAAETGGLREQNSNEAKFIARLTGVNARLLAWAHQSIYWVVRNPTILKLDIALTQATQPWEEETDRFMYHMNLEPIESVVKELRGKEPANELEFYTLSYIRQKGSIILFAKLLGTTLLDKMASEYEYKLTENALLESAIDPRILLLLVPKFSSEVIQGSEGIWVPNGLHVLLDRLWSVLDLSLELAVENPPGENLLQLLKRYLLDWRRKKGSASISDEKEVFQTVDAALLHILLVLDRTTAPGPAKKGSVRSELNSVVDNGVDCFARAIELLEDHKRLYILSRLYQCRKMSRHVLAVWRRIVEGEEDRGGELLDGESEARRYLAKINDRTLVEEYGGWLAHRNPKLGVLVFSETGSKIRFTPERALEVLKQRAPNAVKDFLEHLVFGNHLADYANDLISYYLDSVLSELSHSKTSRSMLLESYTAYRSLPNPKPTYTQFAADNGCEADWWANRQRLLQLLGGNHEAASKYDVTAVFAQVRTYADELIPEMVILYGRQGGHKEALSLLTHGLCDYDTAIRYCLFAGMRTYSTPRVSRTKDILPSRTDQESLFAMLIKEFLEIEDRSDQIMQTSHLLDRFAAYFDIAQILSLIPDSWSVEVLSNFLENAFRDIITERNETLITRSLTSTDNLAANFDHLTHAEACKLRVEDSK